MYKTKSSKFTLLFILLLLCMLLSSQNTLCTANSDNSVLFSVKQVTKVSTFQCEDAISGDAIQQVSTELKRIPDAFIKQIIHDGWSIVVTDLDLNELYDAKEGNVVVGLTCCDEKTIYIRGEAWAAQCSVLHEVGHWFAHYLCNYYGNYAYLPSWKRIYKAESQFFMNQFGYAGTLTESEMFAEIFWLYWTEPEALQLACPKAYTKMDLLIDAFV